MAAEGADAAVEQLQAELRQLRERYAASQEEAAGLRDENRSLATAHGQAREEQAATAEILQMVASSRFDLSGVLNGLAERAYRLCGASSARVYLVDGKVLRMVASVAESDAMLTML